MEKLALFGGKPAIENQAPESLFAWPIMTKEDEDAADLFARDTLISPEEFLFLLEQRDYSKDALRRFAAYSGVDVGIVVGRLQKEEYIDCSWYNDLKVKYELER